jgi:protocatechuate 3,4-dioxygenase alpha subunit
LRILATPSQTVGPYFSIGMRRVDVRVEADAERFTIQGRVLDGDGNGVGDALVETWQADREGNYANSGLRGFGRVATDKDGRFRFATTKPGRAAGAGNEIYAPHIAVMVFARGLLKHLVTRIYFPDEQLNASDHILSLVPEDRRATLIARSLGPNNLEWNVVLQGEAETVFFEC